MTVIAWDGKTLAADKRATNNGYVCAVTKILRMDDDTLVGISGHLPRGLAMVKWLTERKRAIEYGMGIGSFPTEDEKRENYATLLVIHRSGHIEKYESQEYSFIVEEPYHAIGSERGIALAAMHLGKSAREAVELACAISIECGNGIDTLTFDD